MMLRVALTVEWAKASRSRAVWALVVAAGLGTAAATGVYTWVVSTMMEDGLHPGLAEVYVFSVGKASMAPAAAGVIGAMLAGSEYRSRTWALTLLRVPVRWRALSAKLVVVSAVSIMAGALVLTTGSLVAVAAFDTRVVTDNLAASVHFGLGHLFVTVGWGLVGCALGVVLRSTLWALAVLFGSAVVVEPAARLMLSSGDSTGAAVARLFLPLSAGAALQVPALSGVPILLAGNEVGSSFWLNAAVFSVFVVAAVVCSRWAFVRQDLT